MSQPKTEQKTSIILLPAVTAVNLSAKALSFVTGATPEEVKNTAGSILRGDERTSIGLRSQIETANKLIANLEAEIRRARGESVVLATDIIEDDVRHAIRPSLDAEYNVERELYSLLHSRITDTELAEQYKGNAQKEAIYFNGIIESLQGDLKKELSVIETQEADKANLQRAAANARNTIDKLKLELERIEEKRQAELNEQKLKYKTQQARIVSEFESATEFCRDLRRKLQTEIENNKVLVESNEASQHELEALQKENEANFARLQELSTQMQDIRHKVARLNQERQKESESAREEVTLLRERVTKVQDNILIIEKKGAEHKAKQLKKANEELDEIINKYKEQIRSLEEENAANANKHEEESKIHIKMIADLEDKDVADVEKEKKKLESDIKKINNAHLHQKQRLITKRDKNQAEAATSARLATILRDQYESEKSTSSGLQGRLSGLRGELALLEGQRATLQERLTQFERDLQQERDVSEKQLELARKSMVTLYESQRKVITTTYDNEVKKISEELKIQTKLAQEAGKRLTDTRHDLEGRQFSLQNEIKELRQREQSAEEAARLASDRNLDALKRYQAFKIEEEDWANMIKQEKGRSDFARAEVTVQAEKHKQEMGLHAERIKELETELKTANVFISELRNQKESEDAKGKHIQEQKELTHKVQADQINTIQEDIRKLREESKRDRAEAEKLQAEIDRAKAANRGLKVDIQEEIRQKENQADKKEIHNVEVQVVQRN